MGDSTCLMHGFSYASGIPSESKQGNPIHVLGESVSFGRFMTEPLSWEKWSTFSSHKKYVEEAQRYAQPGSVAQKKAFFEAHYKRIAALRAAALLEQQNAAAAKIEAENSSTGDGDHPSFVLNPPQTYVDDDAGEVEDEEVKIQEENEVKDGTLVEREDELVSGNDDVLARIDSVKHLQLDNLENQENVSGSDGTATPKMEERPLLKNCVSSEDVLSVMSKKQSGLSSLKSSIQRKTWKLPSTPVHSKPLSPRFRNVNNAIQSTRKSSVDSSDKTRSSPKSLRKLISSMPFKEPDKEPVKESTGHVPNSSRTPKNCRTPRSTPVKATGNGVSKYASTPISENTRMKTPIDSSARGSKTNGPKWHILSAMQVCTKSLTACRNKLQSPTLSTPFVLRTEERAAKRKQKLEEKFNANEMQEQQQQQKTLKEKAGNELRKLSCTFCFKARPLPDFYKEREMSIINQMKKIPAAGGQRPQSTVLGKPISNKKQGSTASMPIAPPFPSSLAKNRGPPASKSNTILKRNDSNAQNRFLSARMALENRSPNIQH